MQTLHSCHSMQLSGKKITEEKYGDCNFHHETIMKVSSRITQHTETVADGTKVQVTVAEVHGSGGAALQHASG